MLYQEGTELLTGANTQGSRACSVPPSSHHPPQGGGAQVRPAATLVAATRGDRGLLLPWSWGGGPWADPQSPGSWVRGCRASSLLHILCAHACWPIHGGARLRAGQTHSTVTRHRVEALRGVLLGNRDPPRRGPRPQVRFSALATRGRAAAQTPEGSGARWGRGTQRGQGQSRCAAGSVPSGPRLPSYMLPLQP